MRGMTIATFDIIVSNCKRLCITHVAFKKIKNKKQNLYVFFLTVLI